MACNSDTVTGVWLSRLRSPVFRKLHTGYATALGAGLPLMGSLMSGAARGMNKVLWNSPNLLNPLKWKIVQPTVSARSRELLGSVADTTGNSILCYAGGQIEVAGGRIISLPGTSTYTTKAAIDWLQALPELSSMVNANAKPWEQAVQAVNLKNYFMTISRNAMDDANDAAQLGMTTPARTFQELELDAFNKGYFGNAAYKQILAEADKEMRIKYASAELNLKGDYCFAAGTLVHTKEGLKPIEQIQVGDWVLSKPESGEGEQAYKQVTRTFRYEEGEVWSVRYVEKELWDQKADSGDLINYEDIARIIVTPNHPFWVKDKGWVQTKDLQWHDVLELENGRLAYVFQTVPLYRDHPNRDMAWEPLGDSIMCEDGALIDLSGNQFNEFRSKDDPKWQRSFLDEDMENPAFYFRTTVYNFAVEDFHTYFVGTKGVWVHNSCYVDNFGNWQQYIDNGLVPSGRLSIYFDLDEAKALSGVNRGVILVGETIQKNPKNAPNRFQYNEEGAQIIYDTAGNPKQWAIFSYRYDNPNTSSQANNFIRAGDGRAKMPDGSWSMTTIDSNDRTADKLTDGVRWFRFSEPPQTERMDLG